MTLSRFNDIFLIIVLVAQTIGSFFFIRSAKRWDRLMKEKYDELLKTREAMIYWKTMYMRAMTRKIIGFTADKENN